MDNPSASRGSTCHGFARGVSNMVHGAASFCSWMRPGAALALWMLCLLAWPCLTAFAAPRVAGGWSIELPAGWKVEEKEGNQTLFSTAKEDCALTVLEVDCFNGDLPLLATAAASVTGGQDIRAVGEGKGMIFADEYSRYWLGLADDKYLEVSVGSACRGVEPILKSLKVAPNTKNAAPLSALLATMQGPENTKWLLTGERADSLPAVETAEPSGVMPDFAALVDPAVPVPTKKASPDEWRTKNIGQWAIHDKPGEKIWVAVGLYPLKKGNSAEKKAYFVELARKMKGINITTDEDGAYFYTREGARGVVSANDANTVLELFYPEDDANVSELRMELQ